MPDLDSLSPDQRLALRTAAKNPGEVVEPPSAICEVGPSPARRSTRPRSRRWPRSASTSPREYPKPWTDEIVRAADVVVTMGRGDASLDIPVTA